MRRHTFRRSTLVAAALLIGTSFSDARQRSLAGLDGYIQQALRDWEIPGLALAVVKDDSVVISKGYGVRKMGEPALIDDQTMFLIASTTKAMTAACIGMLVDEGKVKWDDPVINYLPKFQLFDPWVTREMTIRDLLTHRSGLDRADNLWYATSYNRAEVISRLRYLKPSWGFRTHYGYQNIMYITAGELIQAVTRKSWDLFIRERLFAPLGMSTSNTTVKELAGESNVASPHERIDGRVQPVPYRNVDNVGAAGAVNSNIHDMARWLRMNLGEGVYEGRRILSKETVSEMQSPQFMLRIDSLGRALRPSTHFLAYGFGWLLGDYRGKKIVQHDGSLDGIRTRVAFIPEERVGVVLLANGPRGALNGALMYRIFDAFLGAPERDWSAELLKIVRDQEAKDSLQERKQTNERVKNTQPSFQLSQCVGTYESELYGEVTVALEKGNLVLSYGPNYQGDLRPWHYDVFQVQWRDRVMGKDRLQFSLDFEGKLKSLTWEGLGEFQRKRKP